MKTAFVDATYYIALLNPRDQFAVAAAELAFNYSGSMVTTTLVLTEVCNMLSAPSYRIMASTLVEELDAAEDTEVIHPDGSLWKQSLDLYASRPDKSWSLTDCMSFIVMQDRAITEALTADRHFEQAGFTMLLKLIELCLTPCLNRIRNQLPRCWFWIGTHDEYEQMLAQ